MLFQRVPVLPEACRFSTRGGRPMKMFLALRYGDVKAMLAGLICIFKTLGWYQGCRAMAFATQRHLLAICKGEGRYPEKGKQRIWFNLHYLKKVHEYLERLDEERAADRFEAIVRGPALQFIGNLIPPSHRLSREYTLHRLWKEMIEKDTNIVSEACPPKGNAASMRVTRCFINEVSRDIGLLPLADKLCYGDYLFWQDYHPNIIFSRTQTLVDGDAICDHTVTWTD
jgi:hypothetical protein